MSLRVHVSALLLLGVILAGCGNSADPPTTAPSFAPGPVSLSGLVRDESGAPVANVRVVAHERISHAKLETISSSDGSFQLDVQEGVYDLGLHSDDARTATCFYGPVLPHSNTREFALYSTQGRASDEIFGKLFSRPGVPAANRLLAIRPLATVTGGGIEVGDVELRTSEDGAFSARIGTDHEVAMDVEVYDQSGTLDEWVDVGKLRKACYVELITDTETPENKLRTGQSELEGSAPTILGQVTDPPDGYQQYTYTEQTVDTYEIHFRGGTIPISAYTYFLGDVTIPNTEQELWGGWKLRAGTNGDWWWDYAININMDDTGGSWDFSDATGDTYSLSIHFTGWHKVSYNSDSPELKNFSYSGG